MYGAPFFWVVQRVEILEPITLFLQNYHSTVISVSKQRYIVCQNVNSWTELTAEIQTIIN